MCLCYGPQHSDTPSPRGRGVTMPIKGARRFGVTGKLSPRYIGPFEILRRIRTLAYELALPPQLSHVHNVFHVSMLRKYVPDPQHVIDF